MTTANLPDIDDVSEAFELLEEWEDRFQYVIDLGKKLPPLPPEEMTEANRVHGCQASVWLVMDLPSPPPPRPPEGASNGHRNGQARVHLRAISDAHIVNGLIAIVLALFNGKTPQEVLQTDAEGFFRRVGLEEHLSPTRRNGLHAMLRRIRELAQNAAAADRA